MLIDGRNISDFMAFLLEDSKEWVSYPPMKEVQSNDWAEENGLEVDLSAPKLDKRQFEISFLLQDKSKYHEFVHFLTETTYRIWIFTDVSKEFKLRVISFSSYSEFLTKSEIKIKLCDDFPLRGFSYTPPTLNFGTSTWLIDNIPFSNYGIYILNGSDEIHKADETKPVLEITNRLMHGVKVASQTLKRKGRKVSLKCLLCANIADFWQNYECFLHDLSQAGERTLQADNQIYKCYYKESKVQDFLKEGDLLRCEFTLEIIITT